jgi:hypothetical protein
VTELIGAYLGAVLVSIIGILVLNIAFVPFYFLIGVLLTRYISRRIIWNVYIASLADIATAKMHTWLTWPFSVPVLIWQIIVANHL